jgi:sugar phosphate isomerase/epimerase
VERAIDAYAAQGIGGITVWRDALEGRSAAAVGERILAAGLTPVSLCRGGFFAAASARVREEAVAANRRAVDQAAALGTDLLVLVCGADPRQTLARSRAQIASAIEALLPHAEAAGVRLGIEPLHPMYAADRSAVNTLSQANNLCAHFSSPWLVVVVDVYHVWWDETLRDELSRCGREGWLAAFHICDWKPDMTDMLYDRELMGKGCIPIRDIRDWAERSGFQGYHEVEIFSHNYWAQDQDRYLEDIQAAYLNAV